MVDSLKNLHHAESDELLALLAAESWSCGGYSALADRIGISYVMMCQTMGKMRPIPMRAVKYLGFDRKTVYVKTK